MIHFEVAQTRCNAPTILKWIPSKAERSSVVYLNLKRCGLDWRETWRMVVQSPFDARLPQRSDLCSMQWRTWHPIPGRMVAEPAQHAAWTITLRISLPWYTSPARTTLTLPDWQSGGFQNLKTPRIRGNCDRQELPMSLRNTARG